MRAKVIVAGFSMFAVKLCRKHFDARSSTVALQTLSYFQSGKYRKQHKSDESGWSKEWMATAIGSGLLFATFVNSCNSVDAFQKKETDIGDLPPRYKYNFIADVVDKAAPGVVCITVKDFHPFLGTVITVGTASGFLVDSSGLVLTNAHVVGNRKSVTVKLHDGRSLDGIVEYVDNNYDLATIRIPAKNLPVLKFGKSSSLRAGEWVIALGSPFSLTNTITAGVVSSSHRPSEELGLHKEMEYIQTDAAINIGNSGGPLINLDTEVIGVNTMKVTSGISFAIPSDYVTEFLERAKSVSSTQKSSIAKKYYLGLSMLTLNSYIAQQLQQQKSNFPDVTKGILIIKVNPGSPSEKAGLQPKDVIVAVNGKEATTVSQIYNYINSGEKMTLTVMRQKSNKIKITVVPEETM